MTTNDRYYSAGATSPTGNHNTGHLNVYKLDVFEDGEWQTGKQAEKRKLLIDLRNSGGCVIILDLLAEDGTITTSTALDINLLVKLLEGRAEITEVAS